MAAEPISSRRMREQSHLQAAAALRGQGTSSTPCEDQALPNITSQRLSPSSQKQEDNLVRKWLRK